MSQIKKLAGQTAYYGISSILGRVLNFVLLPIYTSQLVQEEYGVVTYLYGFTALLNILYTYGLETSFFRFTTKLKSSAPYHHASTAILITSTILSGAFILLSGQVTGYLNHGVKPAYIIYLAIILFIDAIVAIPFAKLRLENRPLKFALTRVTVIVLTIFLNILFLIIFPGIMQGKYLSFLQGTVEKVYNPETKVGYIFISNLIANACYLPLLYKELFSIRLKIDWVAFKPILAYALPIFFMGLAGIFNEQGYSILMAHVFPVNETTDDAMGALGIYTGAFKLSVIMMLGIQAFRYAGEPFFFSHAENKQAPALFARIMHYFVVVNLVLMVGVALNIDLIADIFLRRPQYKLALYVLPILLLAKLFYGIYVNLSVWFKIKDQTIYGTYFALAGGMITLVGNLLLIPILGYYGSAISALACYLLMCILCFLKGRKVFKIPYNFKPLTLYLLMALAFIAIGNIVALENQWLNYLLHLLMSGIFLGIMYLTEGRKIRYKAIDS